MEELTNIHYVAFLGFCIALVFGFVANKTNFCTMGAISDAVNMGLKGRLGAWFLAIGIAILGAQLLDILGFVDLASSRHLTLNFNWLSYLLGGVLFGVGMTLAAGCGQRNLVRFGGGSLKALVVLIVLGLTAYMTMRGVLALLRLAVDAVSFDLTGRAADQGIVSLVAAGFGVEGSTPLRTAVAALFGFGFIIYAVRLRELRSNFDNVLAGVVVGCVVVAAWFLTGFIGQDDFDPVPVEGMSFIGTTANSINYLMTFTGSTISFGIAVVAGVIAGSFVYAITTGNFRIETFSNRADMIGHLTGGVLMGFGGVLALGCTIGQGVTGMSTLALGSVIALVSIMFGSALTMKIQYHMLDDKRFMEAFREALLDLAVPSRSEAV